MKKTIHPEDNWKPLKYTWCFLLVFIWYTNTCCPSLWVQAYDTYGRFSSLMLIQNIGCIIMVATVGLLLMWSHPAMRWTWFCLFMHDIPDNVDKPKGGNVNFLPLQVRWLGLVCLPLLFVNLPTFAMVEEQIFRAGIDNWGNGIICSIVFGLVHCLVGVPIGCGLAISISGVWFTHQYMNKGVELSAAHHTMYNTILLFIAAVFIVVAHLVDTSGKECDSEKHKRSDVLWEAPDEDPPEDDVVEEESSIIV